MKNFPPIPSTIDVRYVDAHTFEVAERLSYLVETSILTKVDTREAKIREGLIKLGWTPPKESAP